MPDWLCAILTEIERRAASRPPWAKSEYAQDTLEKLRKSLAVMPYTHTTVLGRRVRLDDWQSFHRDRLLHALYQIGDLIEGTTGLTPEQISGITGLAPDNVTVLVQSMAKSPQTIHWETTRQVWRITPRGIRWVEESPQTP